MATTMDIRLDYGAWPGDEGDSEESASSLEPTPAFDQTSEADGRQSDNTSNPQQPPDLSISDLFSDSDDIVPDQEFLDAEINMGAAASTANGTSHHTSDPQNPPRRTNRLNSTYATDSPIIDLTESPPQPSERPALTPQGESSQQPSTMPPTLRSHVQPRRVQAAPTAASQSEERPRKRRRLSQSQRSAAEVEQPPQQPVTNDNPAEIEALDLTEVNDESDLSKAISKQQQDAVEAQMKDTSGDECQGRTPLSSYKCPICMDTPEDATSTICGTQQPSPLHNQKPSPKPNKYIQATSSATNASSTPSASPNNPAATTTTPPTTNPPRAPVPSAANPWHAKTSPEPVAPSSR